MEAPADAGATHNSKNLNEQVSGTVSFLDLEFSGLGAAANRSSICGSKGTRTRWVFERIASGQIRNP